MRVLFCGPLQDFSGYAHFSRNFLRMLLDCKDVDVVSRALRYDQADQQFEMPQWMTDTLNKPLSDIDVVIQNTTLNVEAHPVQGKLNGIYFFWETDRIPPMWAQKANMFDFIIVPCRSNALALAHSGVRKPILVFHPPFDLSIYDQEYAPYKLSKDPGNRTIFYNICQLSAKKGIDSLLRAYYAAFADRPQEVLLILKTYINMSNRQNEIAHVKGFIDEIKRGCRIPVQEHPPVIPIMNTISDNDIHGLHKLGHAYVCSSRGEGFCIPAFEAMAHGTTVISNNFGGLDAFINQHTALIYGGCVQNVFNMPHSDPMLYTGVERWFEPSTSEMSDIMRHFHLLRIGSESAILSDENQKQWDSIIQRRQMGREFVRRFDHAKCVEKFELQLHAALSSWKNSGHVTFNTNVEGIQEMKING